MIVREQLIFIVVSCRVAWLCTVFYYHTENCSHQAATVPSIYYPCVTYDITSFLGAGHLTALESNVTLSLVWATEALRQ